MHHFQPRSFFFNRLRTDPISWHNIHHGLIFSLEGSWCALYSVLPKTRRWPMVRSWICFGANAPTETQCFHCCLVFSVLWWIHTSSTVMKRREDLSRLLLNNAKYLFEVDTELRLLAIVSKRNTQLADGFVIRKLSFKTDISAPFHMPTILKVTRNFNLRSARVSSDISYLAISNGGVRRPV